MFPTLPGSTIITTVALFCLRQLLNMADSSKIAANDWLKNLRMQRVMVFLGDAHGNVPVGMNAGVDLLRLIFL